MKIYRSYVFRTTDPILDEIEGVIRESGLKTRQITESSVSPSTLRAWRKRKTKRPQFATISAVALACGATGIKYINGKPVFVVPPRRFKIVAGGKK